MTDDKKVMCELRKKKEVEDAHRLQEDIDRIGEWCETWHMKLNVEKCRVMHIGRKNPRIKYYMKDSTNGRSHELGETDLERDLGVYMSSNLKCRGQVNHAVRKANSVLGTLKRTFMSRNMTIWSKLYKTYIRPHLEFAISAWNPYLKGDIQRLERVQRRATKVAQELKGMTYIDRLKRLDLTTLEKRRERGDLIQLYKITRGIDQVNWVNEPRLGHARAGKRAMFIIENVKGCQRRDKFFTNRATAAWNMLPDSVVEADSVGTFKRMLDGHARSC